jgi:beta-lactamase regulating signal transducer with metallopeptidase domain/HEAT repeat protein
MYLILIFLIKATCLLAVALAASALLHRASAGSRHLVWLVALTGLLALPVVAAWAPLPLRVLPSVESAIESTVSLPPEIQLNSARTATDAAPTRASAAPVISDRFLTPSAGTPLGLATMLAAAWMVVVVALLLYLAYGAWSVRRIVARARPLDDPAWQTPLYEIADRLELDAAPRLLRSDDVKMPFAAGLLSSTIVLPAESDDWSAERRTAVLIHELGHVRRRDLIGHTVGRIACAFYWFHPLVWTAARRLRAESERACDDLALVFGARPSEYAEHLLDIVTCVRDHNTPAVALAMAHRKEFEGRMLAILNPELHRRGLGRLQSGALVGGLTGLALVLGAAAPVPRAAENVARVQATDSTSAPSRSHVPDQAAAEAEATAEASATATATATAGSRTVVHVHNPDRVHEAVRIATRQRADTGARAGSQRAEVLAKMLRTDSSASVRRIAAWGLHNYGDVRVAVDALIAAVTGDADMDVREMAAWALAEAEHDSGATAALVKALRQDKSAQVRSTATWALGSVGDASAVDGLAAMLSDSNAETREVAAWAIGSCEPSRAPAALVKALGDRERDVRLSAAWALYNIHDEETAAAIEAAYKRETDSDVRIGLIRALGAMGESSVDALQRLVTSSDSEVRATAVAELAGGGASGPWPWPRPEPRPFP